MIIKAVVFVLCLFAPLLRVEAKTVYINPFDSDLKKLFYDPYYDPYINNKEVYNPYYLFREALENAGYDVKYTFNGDSMEDVAAIISWNQIHPYFLGKISHFPKERCFLFNFEPHVMWPALYEEYLTHFFGKIFVMFDDIVDNQRYFKFYFPQPMQKMLEEVLSFEEKKLCALINTNKASPVNHPKSLFAERLKVIRFFEKMDSDDFDLYGMGWEGYKTWKGSFKWSWPHKWHILKKYRFVFAYENMCDQKGYITEKIFDAFCAGCVPVYFGASNITDTVPKECFIDRRDFTSDQEVYLYLKTMKKEEYEGYIQAIKEYYNSSLAQLYSVDFFNRLVIDEIKRLDASQSAAMIQGRGL